MRLCLFVGGCAEHRNNRCKDKNSLCYFVKSRIHLKRFTFITATAHLRI